MSSINLDAIRSSVFGNAREAGVPQEFVNKTLSSGKDSAQTPEPPLPAKQEPVLKSLTSPVRDQSTESSLKGKIIGPEVSSDMDNAAKMLKEDGMGAVDIRDQLIKMYTKQGYDEVGVRSFVADFFTDEAIAKIQVSPLATETTAPAAESMGTSAQSQSTIETRETPVVQAEVSVNGQREAPQLGQAQAPMNDEFDGFADFDLSDPNASIDINKAREEAARKRTEAQVERFRSGFDRINEVRRQIAESVGGAVTSILTFANRIETDIRFDPETRKRLKIAILGTGTAITYIGTAAVSPEVAGLVAGTGMVAGGVVAAGETLKRVVPVVASEGVKRTAQAGSFIARVPEAIGLVVALAGGATAEKSREVGKKLSDLSKLPERIQRQKDRESMSDRAEELSQKLDVIRGSLAGARDEKRLALAQQAMVLTQEVYDFAEEVRRAEVPVILNYIARGMQERINRFKVDNKISLPELNEVQEMLGILQEQIADTNTDLRIAKRQSSRQK